MATIEPIGEQERITEVDALRGIALFGVLTMNFVAFAGPGVGLTEAQAAALPTASVDQWSYWGVRWLIGDKANTVFATLFGLGFYIQMTRGAGKPGFEARYRRRLTWLLAFGVANVLLLWVWDILHLYALAGFLLLLMRRWSTRALASFGLVAALYSDKLNELLVQGPLGLSNSDAYFTEAGIAGRQAMMLSGDYPASISYWAEFTWVDWVASTAVLSWIVYALGRFALGAAIGRSALFEDVGRFVPLLRRIAWVALPAGLLISALVRLMYTSAFGDDETIKSIGQALRSPAALILAAGYCAAILLALQKQWGRQTFGKFAPVGRMALTNYLIQGLLYSAVLYGPPLGLGLVGKVGSFAVLAMCIAFFTAQTAFSHWWLARYRFGPMEWVWRTLTYGERPRMRRAEPAVVAI